MLLLNFLLFSSIFLFLSSSNFFLPQLATAWNSQLTPCLAVTGCLPPTTFDALSARCLVLSLLLIK
ncbi:hypothetical protein BVRB_6g142070 isoform B [Beta vulgaris subsp. vulgaris]|nr:hypothetical protein BVRB_6g142070 isoform B [Beta vulgaris subsp. vulgaris]